MMRFGFQPAVAALPRRMAAALIGIVLLALSGCVVPPQAPPGPSPEAVARQQRVDRAQANLNEGLKQYEAGMYTEAMRNLLLALDSGVLTVPQQLLARKHMAFIQCVNNRETICKEEFEKAFELDPKFELSAAEAGHPTWGPIFRLVKAEIELRKSGKSLPQALAKSQPTGEKLMAEGLKAYEDADYSKAIKQLQDALKEALPVAEQVKAHKHIAFSYCVTNRMSLCRAEFDKILVIDPAFELEAAEAGHPSWGPSFRAVKAKQKPAAPAKK